jgi:hypothetical protein
MLGAPPPGSVPNVGAVPGGRIVDPNPNPRAILPADLANSPTFTHLGTVLPAA